MRIENFDEIPSTQDYAKEKRSLREDLIVIAKKQTGGRGTKGRVFSSLEGGVYLSKLSFYENFPAKDAFKIMTGAAVAVCETLRFCGLNPVIKWPNDIFINDRKICGILIEQTVSGKNISSSVVGIGLNVWNEIPDELFTIATTVKKETGKTFSVEEITNRLIKELSKSRSMQEYLSYLGYMGRQATLILGNESVHATLLDVDEEGGLHVDIKGERRRFTAAEVSVRGV